MIGATSVAGARKSRSEERSMSVVIIESAINGGITRRDENPHVPYTVDDVVHDAVVTADAGAAIVHFHLRRADGGRIDAYDELRAAHDEAITRIRASDAPLLWNTFPLGGDATHRFRLFRDLGARPSTRPDVGAYDIGSLNIVSYDRDHGRIDSATTYVNTFDDIRYFFEGFRDLGLRPFLNIFEPGFIRTARVCLDMGLLDEPLLVKFYFSDEYGLPPCRRSIEVYLDLLDGIRHEWFGCYIGGDARAFAPLFASMGGHVRVGLEDFAYATPQPLSNAAIVAGVARALAAHGHAVATVAQARALLQL
jgi:uncharacterized protein (DUF849 family)